MGGCVELWDDAHATFPRERDHGLHQSRPANMSGRSSYGTFALAARAAWARNGSLCA